MSTETEELTQSRVISNPIDTHFICSVCHPQTGLSKCGTKYKRQFKRVTLDRMPCAVCRDLVYKCPDCGLTE